MRNSVGVVGLGYVGLPLALLTKRQGYKVIGLDYSEERVKQINLLKSPFVDEEIAADLKKIGLTATTDYACLKDLDIIIICVPTPVDADHNPDLTPVINACTKVAKGLVKDQLVIIESTVNPGVCEDVVLPILEKNSGLICGVDFYLAHCPERINPGDPNWNVSNIARVVGGYDSRSLKEARLFYESIIDGQIKTMGSLKEAEAVKVVENSFRDVNIAFVNELAMSFNELGIDVVNVIDGAATKPFAFMAHYPGAGVGGHCIPVDPYYLIDYAKKNGFNHQFLKTAREINNGMPSFTVDLLEKSMQTIGLDLENSKVAVLGLSYKANVGDLRESPSLVIINELQSRGANVLAIDPYIASAKGVSNVLTISDLATLAEALKGYDSVIVATAHSEYRVLNAEFFAECGIKAVVDGRNCLNKDSFLSSEIIYSGIGRKLDLKPLKTEKQTHFNAKTPNRSNTIIPTSPRLTSQQS